MIRPLATFDRDIFDRISQSLGKCFRLMEKPRAAVYAVVSLLAVHTGLLAYSAYVHSPTLNEPGHLVAGLSHWKFGRFELYRVNPPLVRMIAALPVMAVGYEEDWSGFYEGPGSRPVFSMGEDFVAANGERSFFLFMIARWACIPFSWMGGIVCYLWARDLFGRPSGVFACTLWCFSPNILGHAALITADVHATSLGVAACYTFWRWLRKPTWTQAAITGCILGLAELAKTTLILFYPLWPFLWIAYRWPDRHCMFRQDWLREAGMLLLRMTIGLYILNLGYGYEDPLKPLKEFHFVSKLFTGNENAKVSSGSVDLKFDAPRPKSINRFADTWLGELPVPFPKNYLIGIDLQQKDFEDFGRPSYLCSKFQERGWWYYYLYALAVKLPLGIWLLTLFVIALHLLLRGISVRWRKQLILLLPPLLIFVVVSSKTGFSHHMRYVFPCFPFAFVWISQVATFFTTKNGVKYRKKVRIIGRLFTAGASLSLVWLLVSSLFIYPHGISYFNELAGGPVGGPKHLINSNVDWGQDLLLLKWWREEQADALWGEPFYLAYYGYLEPADLGFADALPWPLEERPTVQDASEKPKSSISKPLPELAPGYYAISVNFLQGYIWPARDGGKEGRNILQQAVIKQIRSREPYSQVGYSILIYRLE